MLECSELHHSSALWAVVAAMWHAVSHCVTLWHTVARGPLWDQLNTVTSTSHALVCHSTRILVGCCWSMA